MVRIWKRVSTKRKTDVLLPDVSLPDSKALFVNNKKTPRFSYGLSKVFL